jgi:hypothetical protein
MMLSPRWGWSDAGVAAADAAWLAPSHEVLVLILHRENITGVGATPTPGGAAASRRRDIASRKRGVAEVTSAAPAFPPPLRGRDREGGLQAAQRSPSIRVRLFPIRDTKRPHLTRCLSLPLSLSLPRKGGGNRVARILATRSLGISASACSGRWPGVASYHCEDQQGEDQQVAPRRDREAAPWRMISRSK